MKKIFSDSRSFRLLCPLLYGTFVYMMVLLVFDNISHLKENFFGPEVLLSITITTLILEILRLVIKLFEKKPPKSLPIPTRIFLQLIVSGLVAITISSAIVSTYFIVLVQSPIFSEELLTFNIIFLVSSIFYNMLYFSVFYLNKQNQKRLEKEDDLKGEMELQFKSFKNEVNPNLLYDSLESLISLVHESPEKAEDFTDRLASVYRYILINKKNELVELSEEIKAVQNLVFILNHKFEHNIHFKSELEQSILESQIIPGTLQMLIEYLVNSSIITKVQPLKISCTFDDGYLLLQHQLNEKLKSKYQVKACIQKIQQTYTFFTSEPLVELKAYDEHIVKVPLLNVLEEN